MTTDVSQEKPAASGFTPTISIVVAVYNGAATIRECLDSLLAIAYPVEKFEIIVVNNASRDNTAEILADYLPDIKVFNEPKRGPAAARNCGIRHASGDVIALTDVDCTVSPQWLNALVAPLANPAVGISGGKILSRRPHNYIEAFGEQIHDHESAITKYKIPYVITMNWAARKTLLREIGCFDESFLRGSDSEFSMRLAQTDYQIAYAPDALIYHRNEKNLRGLFHEGYIHGRYANKILKKHFSFVESRGYKRFNPKTYQRLYRSFCNMLSGENRQQATCEFVFNSGKKIGKIIGSVQFGFWDF